MNTSNNNRIPGWLVFVGFCCGFWPGIILLVIRMLQGASSDNAARRTQEQRERSYQRTYTSSAGSAQRVYQPPRRPQTVNYRPAEEPQAAPQPAPAPAPKAKGRKGDGLTRRQRELISGKGGKGMWVGGLITLGAGVFTALIVLLGATAGGSLFDGVLASAIVAAAVGIPGAVLTVVGNKNRNRAARFRSYLAMVGDSRRADLDDLAAAIPTDYGQVRKDLETMLDEGFFPGCYIDHGTRSLTNPDEKRKAPRAGTAVPQSPPPTTDADGRKVYAEEKRIRAINSRISDEYVTERMDRLETLTHNILSYVEEHPEKENEVRQFRNHYLPTSLKILESYARFERQGVDGENISAAMKDVEDIMDKLVSGFEKQLDALYAAEAMDVTTDISVLENMMNMEGLGPLSPFDTRRKPEVTEEK